MKKLFILLIILSSASAFSASNLKLSSEDIDFRFLDGLGMNNSIGVYQGVNLVAEVNWRTHKKKGLGSQTLYLGTLSKYIIQYNHLRDIAKHMGVDLLINTNNYMIDLVSLDIDKDLTVKVVEKE